MDNLHEHTGEGPTFHRGWPLPAGTHLYIQLTGGQPWLVIYSSFWQSTAAIGPDLIE